MQVQAFAHRWEAWLYGVIGLRLARWLAASGLGARPWAWKLIARIWPALASAVALIAAFENTRPIYWVWDGDEESGADVDEILADVSEMINRAPTPLGGDDYIVFVRRLGPLPGEENGARVEFPAFEETLVQREIVARWTLAGNRWRDWKRGNGKERLRRVLEEAQPTRDAPVTIIAAAVEGAVMANIFLRMKKGGQALPFSSPQLPSALALLFAPAVEFLACSDLLLEPLKDGGFCLLARRTQEQKRLQFLCRRFQQVRRGDQDLTLIVGPILSERDLHVGQNDLRPERTLAVILLRHDAFLLSPVGRGRRTHPPCGEKAHVLPLPTRG